MGTKWQMPLAVIGKPTGDGRQFDEGALGHRNLPLPFRYVAEDSGGHANAVIVGHISHIGKEKDGVLPAKGEFYDDESWPENVREAATAARMFVDKKVIGPSVDLDQQEVEHVPEPKAYAAWKKEQRTKLKAAKLAHASATGSDCGCAASEPVMAEEAYDGPRLRLIRSGRMASATLVHIPAFAELSGHAKLTPIDSSDPNVAGTTSSAMVAGAEMTIVWDDVDWGAKIENDAVMAADQEEGGWRLDSGIWLSDDEFEEFAKKKLPRPNKDGQPELQGTDAEGSGGGAWAAQPNNGAKRSEMDAEDFVDPEGRRFPIASCSDIADAVSSYGRANPKIPYAQFKSRLTAIAKRKGCTDSLPDNWKAGEKMAALIAGAQTAAPAAPPKEWFDNPKLEGPTPLHIGDDGRVYGHVAVWDTCHVGFDHCVKPPKSQTSYAYFHTGETVTADGSRVATGRLTYGDGGHALPNLTYRAAAEHYDRTSHVGAYVRAGEDEHGIWVAGAVAPEADDNALRTMRANPLSGDWRRVGGNLEMVAALHVPTAGFPIPRMLVASATGEEADEEMFSLVAAGALPRVVDEGDEALTASVGGLPDTEELGRAIARGMIAEQKALAAQEARAAEWAALVAAATSPASDYDEARSDLMAALIE
jgi:hypothetical protein